MSAGEATVAALAEALHEDACGCQRPVPIHAYDYRRDARVVLASDELAGLLAEARAQALRDASAAYDPDGEVQARGWVIGWLSERAEMEAGR